MTQTLAISRDAHTDENGNPFHRWAIRDGNVTIAELLVSTHNAEIGWVWVRADHRGNGHATALYERAAAEMVIYHAPASHRTPEGDSFAHRVGGPIMPNCTTCCADL